MVELELPILGFAFWKSCCFSYRTSIFELLFSADIDFSLGSNWRRLIFVLSFLVYLRLFKNHVFFKPQSWHSRPFQNMSSYQSSKKHLSFARNYETNLKLLLSNRRVFQRIRLSSSNLFPSWCTQSMTF